MSITPARASICVPGYVLTSTRTVPQKLAAALTSYTRSHASLSILRLFSLTSGTPDRYSIKRRPDFPLTVMWRDVSATHTCFCHLFIFLRQTQRLLFLVRHGVFWPLCTCHSRLFQPVHSAAWNRKMPLFLYIYFLTVLIFPLNGQMFACPEFKHLTAQ